jgi:large subunit ribosomal protein L21
MHRLANEDQMFAIIELSGKQYKVTLHDVVTCHRLHEAQVGQTLTLDKVLMIGSRHYTIVGRPYVDAALFRLYATVMEQGKGPKMFIERFKRRKNYDRRIGYRSHTTTLKIAAYEVGVPSPPSSLIQETIPNH